MSNLDNTGMFDQLAAAIQQPRYTQEGLSPEYQGRLEKLRAIVASLPDPLKLPAGYSIQHEGHWFLAWGTNWEYSGGGIESEATGLLIPWPGAGTAPKKEGVQSYPLSDLPPSLLESLDRMQGIDPKGEAGSKKTPLHLLPPEFLIQTAEALKTGCAKYGPWNWRSAKVECQTYYGAILRHLLAWQSGQDTDEESGLPHLAHAAANIAILMDAAKAGTLYDNRPKIENISKP